jgi:hypothetical protein
MQATKTDYNLKIWRQKTTEKNDEKIIRCQATSRPAPRPRGSPSGGG